MVLGVVAAGLVLGPGCSVTPIPDVSSQWEPMCEGHQRYCPVVFALKPGTEKSAEVRGDFRDGGWIAGVPMGLDGGAWWAVIPVPYGSPVQYKYVLDGSRWILDPANPKTVRDASGNTNNLVPTVTCEPWVCDAGW